MNSTCNRDFDVVELDLSVYRLTAIKKTAYKFLDRATVTISTDSQCARLQFVRNKSAQELNDIIRDFQDELLDQELREAVDAETAGIRNLLIAQAFSAANLVFPELDSESPLLQGNSEANDSRK